MSGRLQNPRIEVTYVDVGTSATEHLDDEPVHATRRSILQAASALFRERGYGSVSVRDIGAVAGISPSTLYHHFADKRAILFAISERFMVDFVEEMRVTAAHPGSPTERLHRLIARHVTYQYEHRNHLLVGHHFRRVLAPDERARVLELMREYRLMVLEIVEEGSAEATFSVRDPEITVSSIVDMVNGLRDWFCDDGRLGIDELAETYAEQALRLCGVVQ